MKEFIVWDKEDKKFIKPKVDFYRERYETGKYIDNEIDGSIITSVKYGNIEDLLHYIGKTDIEGNKIYADSSIVEFIANMGEANRKMIGYFQYNDSNLKYGIKTFIPIQTYDFFEFDNEKMHSFKIIDTLQENRLGLLSKRQQNELP
jgi:hypothetical protein